MINGNIYGRCLGLLSAAMYICSLKGIPFTVWQINNPKHNFQEDNFAHQGRTNNSTEQVVIFFFEKICLLNS